VTRWARVDATGAQYFIEAAGRLEAAAALIEEAASLALQEARRRQPPQTEPLASPQVPFPLPQKRNLSRAA
jgi:hypothetical protein